MWLKCSQYSKNWVFPLLPAICFKLLITRTLDNSNFLRFPLKVRVIGSRLQFMKVSNVKQRNNFDWYQHVQRNVINLISSPIPSFLQLPCGTQYLKCHQLNFKRLSPFSKSSLILNISSICLSIQQAPKYLFIFMRNLDLKC